MNIETKNAYAVLDKKSYGNRPLGSLRGRSGGMSL
jgi:hypothetical protein